VAGKKPVEQRRSGSPDMKITSRRWCKANPDRRTHHQINSDLNIFRNWFFIGNDNAATGINRFSFPREGTLRRAKTAVE
jgi:accessory colonization factor AcfC